MHTLRHTNATLFVTVLSACLGLLIGGVPLEAYAQQVRAATADTSQPATDAQAQCPDPASLEAERLLNRGFLSGPFLSFITEVRRLIDNGNLDRDGSFDLDISFNSPAHGHVYSMTISNRMGSQRFSTVAEIFAEYVESDLTISNLRFYDQNETYLSVTFQTSGSELITNVTIQQESPEQAQKLAATYTSAFLAAGCRERGKPAELFYENTQALAANNQVLIVTRLPRAALSVPLVEKPAAN